MEKTHYVMPDPKYGYHAWYRQEEEYDDHHDDTPDWLVLRDGVSLKDAVAALAEGGDRYAMRIESEEQLGANREEILELCREKKIMLLREVREKCFFNYCDGREYEIYTMTGYGSVDDAASVITRGLHKILTAEEQAAQVAKIQHERRQRELAKGKEICRKFFILTARQADRELLRVRKKLEEQIKKDPDIKDVPYRERYDVFQKQRQLRGRIEELEAAREYLLHKDELEA